MPISWAVSLALMTNSDCPPLVGILLFTPIRLGIGVGCQAKQEQHGQQDFKVLFHNIFDLVIGEKMD